MKKHNQKVVFASVFIVSLVVFGFLIFNISQNTNKDKANTISTINKSNLESLVKEDKSFFVIFGEAKAPSTKKLIDSTLTQIDEINNKVYFFDTSVYIDNLFDSELKKDEKNKVINEYVKFLNTYEISTSPTIILFKDKDKTSLGKYLPNSYFETSKEKQQKLILKKANDKLYDWIFAND